MTHSKIITEANGLKLIELSSNCGDIFEMETGAASPEIAGTFPEKAFVAAWLDHTVLIGTFEGGEFRFHDQDTFEPGFVRRMRVFDGEKEMMLWRAGKGFRARLREDNAEGAGTHVVVAEQVLYGTRRVGEHAGRFTEITEERGTTLILPFGGIRVDAGKPRIFIKTHNYIGENEVHQATYVDCRFVSFTDGVNDLT